MEALPLLVVPHPLNDLTPQQVRDLARAAYPIVVEQLTGTQPQAPHTHAQYRHPAAREGAASA
jgi:hypothetical protein